MTRIHVKQNRYCFCAKRPHTSNHVWFDINYAKSKLYNYLSLYYIKKAFHYCKHLSLWIFWMTIICMMQTRPLQIPSHTHTHTHIHRLGCIRMEERNVCIFNLFTWKYNSKDILDFSTKQDLLVDCFICSLRVWYCTTENLEM